jgi:predicted transcriptional regulator
MSGDSPFLAKIQEDADHEIDALVALVAERAERVRRVLLSVDLAVPERLRAMLGDVGTTEPPVMAVSGYAVETPAPPVPPTPQPAPSPGPAPPPPPAPPAPSTPAERGDTFIEWPEEVAGMPAAHGRHTRQKLDAAYAQLKVLKYAKVNSTVTVSEIAAHLNLRSDNVTRYVKALIGAGLMTVTGERRWSHGERPAAGGRMSIEYAAVVEPASQNDLNTVRAAMVKRAGHKFTAHNLVEDTGLYYETVRTVLETLTASGAVTCTKRTTGPWQYLYEKPQAGTNGNGHDTATERTHGGDAAVPGTGHRSFRYGANAEQARLVATVRKQLGADAVRMGQNGHAIIDLGAGRGKVTVGSKPGPKALKKLRDAGLTG